jgi:hypothetical protein
VDGVEVGPGTMVADDDCILLTRDIMVVARKGNIRLAKILVSPNTHLTGIYKKEILKRYPDEFYQTGVDIIRPSRFEQEDLRQRVGNGSILDWRCTQLCHREEAESAEE